MHYIISNGGIDTEADYPYIAKDDKCSKEKEGRCASHLTCPASPDRGQTAAHRLLPMLHLEAALASPDGKIQVTMKPMIRGREPCSALRRAAGRGFRKVVTLDAWEAVPPGNETALMQAVSQHPVAVGMCCGDFLAVGPSTLCSDGRTLTNAHLPQARRPCPAIDS